MSAVKAGRVGNETTLRCVGFAGTLGYGETEPADEVVALTQDLDTSRASQQIQRYSSSLDDR